MSNVLFVVHNVTGISEMLPVALAMKKNGRLRPVFFIHHCRENIEAALTELDDLGFEYLTDLTSDASAALQPAPQMKIANRSAASMRGSLEKSNIFSTKSPRDLLKLWLPEFFIDFFRLLAEFYRCYRDMRLEVILARRVLALFSPSLIVFCAPPALGYETFFIRASRRRKTRILTVLTSDFSKTDEEEFRFMRALPQFSKVYEVRSIKNRIIAKIAPGNTISLGGLRVFPYPASKILGATFAGANTPAFEWLTSNTVTAPNLDIIEYYNASHSNIANLVLTGKPTNDILFQQIQDAPKQRVGFCKKHKLSTQKNMVLCAIPQHAEEGVLSWDEHWKEIDDLIRSLNVSHNVNIVLTLHPRMDRKAYAFLEDKYPVRIATWKTDMIIPLCDIYVAYESSTLWTALKCNKPSINVLLNKKPIYECYSNIPGFFNAHGKFEITTNLKLLLSRSKKSEVCEALGQGAQRIGLLDGRAVNRILSIIEKESA